MEIEENKLFRLVKVMKELLKIYEVKTDEDLIFKHNLKIKMEVYNQMLENKGIDEYLKNLESKKDKIGLIEMLKKEGTNEI